MRVAIFTLQISPYHNARYMGACEHFDELHIISTQNEGDFKEFLATDLGRYNVHEVFDGVDQYELALRNGALGTKINEALSKIRPDVIFVAGWSSPESFVALKYGRDNSIPVCLMSESQRDDAKRSLLREWVKRQLVSQFSGALVGGAPHSEYIESLGIPTNYVELGYNAVDNEHFKRGAEAARASKVNLRAKYNLPRRYFLASARFIKKKNLPALVSAYANASHKVSEIPDLVLLGDGIEREAICMTAKKAGVEHKVHLPGFVGYHELPTFYGLAELFIHVSMTEQWGLVINEAMAAGVPVMCSDRCGATRSLISHGRNGLVSKTDAQSIEDTIVQFLTMSSSEISEIREVASNTISSWGPERFGLGASNLATRVVKRRHPGELSLISRILIQNLKQKVIKSVA